jgi:hypothetical protein
MQVASVVPVTLQVTVNALMNHTNQEGRASLEVMRRKKK